MTRKIIEEIYESFIELHVMKYKESTDKNLKKITLEYCMAEAHKMFPQLKKIYNKELKDDDVFINKMSALFEEYMEWG